MPTPVRNLRGELLNAIQFSQKSKGDFARDGGMQPSTLSRILNGEHIPSMETFEALIKPSVPEVMQYKLWESYLRTSLPTDIAEQLRISVRAGRTVYQQLAQPETRDKVLQLFDDLDPVMKEAVCFFVMHGDVPRFRTPIIELYLANIND